MKTIVLALLVSIILIGCDSGNDNDGSGGNNISEDTIIGHGRLYILPQNVERLIFLIKMIHLQSIL